MASWSIPMVTYMRDTSTMAWPLAKAILQKLEVEATMDNGRIIDGMDMELKQVMMGQSIQVNSWTIKNMDQGNLQVEMGASIMVTGNKMLSMARVHLYGLTATSTMGNGSTTK
jgi:hypothetical protein